MSLKSKKSNVLTVTMSELQFILDFASETKLPFVIWGEKAVGKTTCIKDFAKANGYRLEVLHLATQDIADLVGMMAKVPEDGESEKLHRLFEESCMGKDLTQAEYAWVKEAMLNKKMKTVWTRPTWLHNDPEIPTIIFLDEINRSNKFVSAAMLPFLLEGVLHQHSIGPNDFIVAACNPSTGNYQVNDAFEYDAALKDRCGHVILEPTKAEFLEYAEQYIDDVTLSVIKKNDKYIALNDFDLAFTIEPSRRSLVNVMGKVGHKSIKWLRQKGKYVIGTYLGTKFLEDWWTAKFQRDNYLDINDLLNFEGNRQRITDTISAVVNGVVTVKQDIYEESLDRMVDWMNTQYVDGHTKVDWAFKYFGLPFIPKDSIASTLSKVNLLSKPLLVNDFVNSGLLSELPELKKLSDFEELVKNPA